MSITIADLKVRDVIITTEVEGGEYGLYTVLSMDDGAGIAILKPAGFSRARCVLTACEGEEGAPRFTLSQVVTWGELSPCERDGESFNPEAVVEIVRAFPDGAVYETKDYFDALVRARKSLALPKGVSAFSDWCDVAPLNEGRNNPHVIRLGDAERIYLYITGEHHHWVTSLDMHGESVASAICLLSRDESEAVQKYADGAAKEVDLSEAKFIQLRSAALGGGSVIGCFVGDIVTVETASGVQYLQVTGGSDSEIQVQNLTTNEAGTLRVKAVHDEDWCDDEEVKYDLALHLVKAGGSVEPVYVNSFAVLPTRNPDAVSEIHALYEAQEEPLNRFMNLLEDEIEAEKEKHANRKIPRWLELLEELSSMTLDAKKSRSVLRLQYLKDTVMRAVGITVANARYEGNKYLNKMREALEAVAELNER